MPIHCQAADEVHHCERGARQAQGLGEQGPRESHARRRVGESCHGHHLSSERANQAAPAAVSAANANAQTARPASVSMPSAVSAPPSAMSAASGSPLGSTGMKLVGSTFENVIARDFGADGPWQKLGTDVTEFKVAGAKAYWAPVLDFCTKEIVASDISTSPDLAQQHRMLDRLLEALPDGAAPTMHSDMGWQYQHESYASRLEGAGITQSMSRKGNCIDNAATEQLFGHVKDEFYRGREWGSFGDFKRDLEGYIAHWNTRRRQVRLKGLTPEEFRNRALAA